MTIILFATASAGIFFLWNRFFEPVPLRVAVLLWLVCAAYEAPTLLTQRVDNRHALPRAFFVKSFDVEPDFGRAARLTTTIAEFRHRAVVDHIPDRVRSAVPELASGGPLTGGAVRMTTYDSNSTEFDVDSSGWNLLVTSDVNWPGWRAYWNGKRQPTVTVNGAFLGCFIPPGHARFRFRYRPQEFDLGVRIGAIALVVLTATLTLWSQRRAAGTPSKRR